MISYKKRPNDIDIRSFSRLNNVSPSEEWFNFEREGEITEDYVVVHWYVWWEEESVKDPYHPSLHNLAVVFSACCLAIISVNTRGMSIETTLASLT